MDFLATVSLYMLYILIIFPSCSFYLIVFYFIGEIPDPYVKLRVRTSPNSKQRTSTKGDEVNPEWNEDFKFYLNPNMKNTLGKSMSFAFFIDLH